MTRKVPVGDLVALVDDDDYELVSAHEWYLLVGRRNRYAQTTLAGRSVLMHRLILDAPDGVDVDHENHDGLDNVRSNLRLATRSQNCMNRRMRSDNTSGFKGVSFRKVTYKKTGKHSGEWAGKWVAQIKAGGETVHLGPFATAEEAAAAYDAAALKHFGEYALTNEMMAS